MLEHSADRKFPGPPSPLVTKSGGRNRAPKSTLDRLELLGLLPVALDGLAAWQAVLEMCIECTGWSPAVFVEAYSACGEGLDDGNTPRFPYMPHVLKYVVMELLKNSCRATADMLSATTDLQVEDVPINVIVCADEDHVTICVSDRARGIPRGVNAWLYLYTTVAGLHSDDSRVEVCVFLPDWESFIGVCLCLCFSFLMYISLEHIGTPYPEAGRCSFHHSTPSLISGQKRSVWWRETIGWTWRRPQNAVVRPGSGLRRL